MSRPNEFSPATQQMALTRQKNRCGSCGTRIHQLGNAGQAQHRFGEGAQAHHMQLVRMGGSALLANCVILCRSCHYSVHEGGRYARGTVDSKASDYPHFYG